MKPWFVTCFASGNEYIREMEGMIASLKVHHPDVSVITATNPIPQGEWGETTCYKATWIRNVWLMYHDRFGDLVWIDADARINKPITPPFEENKLFFGAKMYRGKSARRRRWWSTGTVWLRGDVGDTLDAWVESPGNTDEEMLNALSAVPYLDLLDSLTGVCSLKSRRYNGRIPESSIVHWNMSRKVLGKLRNWPPTEEERANAIVCDNANVQPSRVYRRGGSISRWPSRSTGHC